MSYVLKTSPRGGGRFPLPFKIILGIIVLLAVFYFIFPRALSSFFVTIVRPFWNVGQNVQNGNTLVSISDLLKENDDLKKTLAENEARNQASDLLQKENDELKTLLGRTPSQHVILGQILKKPPFSAYDIFILDIGKDVGLQKGNRVYASGNIPIGEIAEVDGNTSKVRLYSSSGETFDVLIGSSSIQAVATGRGGGTFEATVPRDSKIFKGESVIVPSLSDAFVGKIENILSDPSHPFSVVLFSQPFNLFEMRWVLIDVSQNKGNE